MYKRYIAILNIALMSLSLYGCNKVEAVENKYTSEQIESYNKSILEACNYEYNNSISEDNIIAQTNLDMLKNSYNDRQVNYKLDITSDVSDFVSLVSSTIEDRYYWENKLGPYDSSYDITDDELVDIENVYKTHEDDKMYSELTNNIIYRINNLDNVKRDSYSAYLNEVYSICNDYNKLSDKFKNLVSNIDELKNNLYDLGGSLETNFNLEESLYWWDVVEGKIDPEVTPYNGPSNEDLGIKVDDSKTYLDHDGSVLDDSGEMMEEPSFEESTEEYESKESTEDESIENIEESTENIESEVFIDGTVESEVESTESNNETESETYSIQESEVEQEETKSNLTQEHKYIIDIPRTWDDCIVNNTETYEVVSRDKIYEHIASMDSKLSYENGKLYIDLENAPETGEIDLLGGYYISWIIEKHEPSEFRLTDYIYWDTNGFKVRCVNESGRMVTLEGYVSDDTVFISNITDILDKINPARAYIYNRNDMMDYEEYEEETLESMEETLENSEEGLESTDETMGE